MRKRRMWDGQVAMFLLAAVVLAGLVAHPVAAVEGDVDWLNVVGRIPLEDDIFDSQIVVFFDSPVVLPPGVDGNVVPPLAVTPSLPGDFRVEDNFVLFRPVSMPSMVNIVFEVTLESTLQSADGKLLNPAQGRFVIANFAFEAKKLWVIDDAPEGLTAGLLFPAAVDLARVKEHLSVVGSNGEPAPFALEPGDNETMVRIVLPGGGERPASISLAEGLGDASGRLRPMKAQTLPFPQRKPLTVRGVDWTIFSREERVIKMWFSAAVEAEELREHLTVRNADDGTAVPFEIVTRRETGSHRIALDLPPSDSARVSIAIAEGLQACDRSTLREPYAKILEGKVSVSEPATLRIRDTWWRDWDWRSRGKRGPALSVRLSKSPDAAELKKHVEFDPPLDNMIVDPAYGGTFRIYGDWNSKQRYEMRIAPGLKLGEGAALKEAVTTRIETEEIRPYAGFGLTGQYYLPKRNGLKLPLETRNAGEVELVLYRMFPSNVAVALQDMQNGEGGAHFNHAWCEEVARTGLTIAARPDRIVETPVDLDSLFPADKKGVFSLRATAKDGAEATKLILWTDIGVLAHWQGGGTNESELVMFAHDLSSLAPLSLAKVSVYSTKNQLLGATNTDSDGIARLGPFNESLGAPRVAVIEHEDDFTFLELKTREEDARPFTDQMPYFDRKGYDAFVYADRDLYRPGATVHAHWLVRTNYGDPLGDVPLMAKVLKPNGRELLSETVMLSPLGTGGIDVPTQKAYPTGKYTVQLSVPGSKKAIGSYKFGLEEFVPNRIEATVTLDEDVWLAGKDYKIHVNAQHLFGASASERKCDALVVLKRGGFDPPEWKGYHFDNDSEFVLEPVPCGDARTDEEGNAEFTFNYAAPVGVTFPIAAITVGRVYELGGRAVGARAESTLSPSDTCLGVRVANAPYGKGIEVFAAAVTPDGAPSDIDRVSVALEKQVWNYYVRRYYSHHESKWAESFNAIDTREVALANGKGSTSFALGGSGYYRVRVFSEKTLQYSTLSFYAHGGQYQLVDSTRPSLIKVKLDKERYDVGDEVEVRIESPFNGKGVVVVQGGNIQRMRPVDIEDNAGVVRFTVGREQCPNVWVEATVIHAVEGGRNQVYPFSSFAMTNLAVMDPLRSLDVAFAALPTEIRPAANARFDVDVRDAGGNPVEAELTLAAVDEGIHAITGYESPDPHAWLFRTRRPDFRRAHYYDKVAYDFIEPPIGGDALLRQIGKRISTVEENWIRPVALWSGTVPTDANGHASIALDIPEFTGKLRLVAVASSSAALGAESANVFVRRPYMLRTSLPRFLLPGDSAQCRATFFNNSDEACKAHVSWSLGGAIREGSGSRQMDVPAHGEASLTADLNAGREIAGGEVRWETVVLDVHGLEVEALTKVDSLPVLAPAAFKSHHETIALEPGETRELRNTRFLDDERTELELTVGASPLLQLQDALGYVVRYPYGCVEQVTSRLMPMYLLRQNETLTTDVLTEHLDIENYLQAGIDRLFSMQTPSGGLGYWPGAQTPYPYGSVYALHFLTLVKNGRELEAPAKNFEALQEYVRERARDWIASSHSDLFLRAYATYVLALDGDLEAVQQIERFDAVSVPRSARFLLAAALARSTQDHDRVKLYLAEVPTSIWDVHERGGTLNSSIRNTAIELIAHQQMGGPAEDMAGKARELVDYLKAHRYGSTQETAFILTALTTYLAGLSEGTAAAAATITSPDREDTIEGTAVFRASQQGAGCAFTVANTGDSVIFVNLTTRGVPEAPETEAVSEGGLSIERTFRTNAGSEYADTSFEQTGTCIVDLTIHCDKDLENVIVADLLPAGLEVENPRLNADSLPGAAFEEAVAPSYLDVRDDRLVLAFDTLPKGYHHFYYVARAVTPGSYQHPAAQAECMYDAAVRATTASSHIEVK